MCRHRVWLLLLLAGVSVGAAEAQTNGSSSPNEPEERTISLSCLQESSNLAWNYSEGWVSCLNHGLHRARSRRMCS